MRQLLLTLSLILFPLFCYGRGERQSESSYQGIGQQGFFSISSHSWTAVPSTSAIDSSRLAVTFDVPSTYPFAVVIAFTVTSSSPTVNIATGAYIAPSDPPITFSINNNVRTWARYLGASSTDFYMIEWK